MAIVSGFVSAPSGRSIGAFGSLAASDCTLVLIGDSEFSASSWFLSNVSSVPHLPVCGTGLDIGHGSGNVQINRLGLALDSLDLLAAVRFSALDNFCWPASVIW